MNTQETKLSVIDESKKKFELACKDAASLQIVNNFGAAFTAVNVIALLREALTDEVMNKVFMPLMNTKVGFLTDRNGRPRSGGRPALPVYSAPGGSGCDYRRGKYRASSYRQSVQHHC